MTLRFKVRVHCGEWEDIEQYVFFDKTPCNYGGERKWFLCPRCQRRVAILYGVGKMFLCRHCYDLNYASQHMQCHERHMEKARAIRLRLGGSANLFDPFPEKPKGMHWRVYLQLYKKAEAAHYSSLTLALRNLGCDWP